MSSGLRLKPEEKKALVDAFDAKSQKKVPRVRYEPMAQDDFHLIADWTYFAILSLLELPECRFEVNWIASRLGISETRAEECMIRLQHMKIVADVDGVWKQVRQPLKADLTESTPVTRKFHKGVLARAAKTIDSVPIDVRDYSAMTFAMDPALVPYAVKRIRHFRRELVEELERADVPKEVYQVAIQLFPLSKKEKKC
jgi:uncharacterized protein (TIGR02147 family)